MKNPSTYDIATQQRAEELSEKIRDTAGSFVSLGKAWASHGLRVAESTLDVAQRSLAETSRTLNDIEKSLR